ncbi:MAG: CatA-like O-acetyltransferase [Pseudomonadota bacterium]
MRWIQFEQAHRRKHFEFFRDLNHPHFSVCAQVEIGTWAAALRTRGWRLNTGLVYLLARAANDICEFRQRLREQGVVEHEVVHPSFAVTTEATDVFSFCEVAFSEDAGAFMARAVQTIEARHLDPSMDDVPGRDDYLFMSAFPWVAFTSVSHPMQYHPHDSVPRITWGKFVDSGGQLRMPLSVQAHHALVDGVHMGRYFQRVEELASMPDLVLAADARQEPSPACPFDVR